MDSRQIFLNEMLPATKLRLTDGKIIESVPEPKEKEKKCVICVVDMSSHRKCRWPVDKVNFYIYDKEKFKYEAETWSDLSYKDKKWSGDFGDIRPIDSIDYCRPHASYITFESLLFRIGGRCCSYLREPCSHYPPTTIGSNMVDIIDLNSESELMVAKEGPRMFSSRLDPHLLILRRRLYVAGGFRHRADPEARIEDIIFMEVLNTNTADWFWESLPNPPPYNVKSVAELPYSPVIAGAVESMGTIVVGFSNYGNYTFYTYQPTTSTWPCCTTYTNISLKRDLDLLCWRTAVVSGEFMLWVWCPGGSRLSTLLYVMDLENDELITFDLFEKKVLPHIRKLTTNYGVPPTLLKLEEREFCVFWTQCDDPHYSFGPDTYSALHASTFTLETGEGKLNVKQKEHYISLVPDVESIDLEQICIADVPDNKQHLLKP